MLHMDIKSLGRLPRINHFVSVDFVDWLQGKNDWEISAVRPTPCESTKFSDGTAYFVVGRAH